MLKNAAPWAFSPRTCSVGKARVLAVAALAALALPLPARAGSVTGALSITVQPPAMALVINPSSATLACNAAAGTVVSALSVSGGDGGAVTYTLAGDTTDFAIAGSNVVVGPNGIAAADCGKTFSESVTATQP